MRKNTLLWGVVFSLTTSLPSWAQDETTDPVDPTAETQQEETQEEIQTETPATSASEDTDETTTEDGDKFSSRDRLIQTWAGDAPEAEPVDLSNYEQAINDAQAALDAAAEDITEEELAALNQTLTDAQAALETAQTDAETAQGHAEIEALVADLTDEQVFALNRALNNTLNSPFAPELTAEQLQQIIDGDYSKQQINAFTKALEEEAKFESLAARFEAKAEASGNDKHLLQAERLRLKATTQSDRFMAKVEGTSPSAAAKNNAKQNAKSAAKTVAKNQAKDAAREAAKTLRKEQAKQRAKEKSKGKSSV